MPPKKIVPAPLPASASTEGHFIEIVGARTHNLQNVTLRIPKNQLVVVTGVSGSGKSSITMDTLYAEGQRRYVESMSSYARQFLSRMKKPDVDYIKGICPAIAVEQRTSGGNQRSTVGSMTEVYDFMRMFFARAGETISPISGAVVKKQTVTDVVNYLKTLAQDARQMLYIPLGMQYPDRTLQQELSLLLQKGYSRMLKDNEIQQIEDVLADPDFDASQPVKTYKALALKVLIDRFVIDHEDPETWKRAADSINTAFAESGGECVLADYETGVQMPFSNRFELDGITFLQPTPQLFNYNNSYGACPVCEGYGKVIGLAEEKIIPDQRKSILEGAIAPWAGAYKSEWQNPLERNAHKFDFPLHKPYQELNNAQKELLWKGNAYFEGINAFFDYVQTKLYVIQNRILLARYRGRTNCKNCNSSRLRIEASYVKIDGKSITELVNYSVADMARFFDTLLLNSYQLEVGKRLLLEIKQRLGFMNNVGLGYLSLNRVATTLSGGETQRINLTRILGSNLTSSMYLLDEPSVGLHPRDSLQLVNVLRSLRDLGNTVVVVEHEEDIIRNADFLIDMGPAAGINGGHLIYAGPYEGIVEAAPTSLTVGYLTGRLRIPVPARRPMRNRIVIHGARQFNLKNVSATIPLNALTVVSGVSGSGKTTLIKGLLYPALCKALGLPMPLSGDGEEPQYDTLEGDLNMIKSVEMITQQAIGQSSRSNPVTYTKAYDDIRELMSQQPKAKIRGLKPSAFSFNVEGGRCETCKGDGVQVVEMQFMADVQLECEDCKGKRFKPEVLEVTYNDKNIFDILCMSVTESITFFAKYKGIIKALSPLENVGLGYIHLGQSVSTLSGGEAQRLKLALFLSKEGKQNQTFFIFDEPTTGLHFEDVRVLLDALQSLVEKGHTVVVVEHNMDVIKSADWLLDLGPDGGTDGGYLVYQGPPEGLLDIPTSHTGRFLKEKLLPQEISKAKKGK